MATIRKRIGDIAADVIRSAPNGIRWADLFRAVEAESPDVNRNTLVGSLHHFRSNLPAGIGKPERGLYIYEPNATALDDRDLVPAIPTKFREEDFYQPFATWLREDIEEATVAVPLGGNVLGSKWGTPDVIGLFRPRATDPIRFPEEVIAAEIKTDTHALIVAFGQACAYKLFAHRVYLVVPRTAPKPDIQRLDALAAVVGIGLVLFNPEDPDNSDFEVRARAAKHEPDYFYTNQAIAKCAAALSL